MFQNILFALNMTLTLFRYPNMFSVIKHSFMNSVTKLIGNFQGFIFSWTRIIESIQLRLKKLKFIMNAIYLGFGVLLQYKTKSSTRLTSFKHLIQFKVKKYRKPIFRRERVVIEHTKILSQKVHLNIC